MKWIWLVILTTVSIVCTCSEPCKWNQYLGNSGRTAYTECSIPDSLEVLWEITLDGVAGTPFIVGDKVIVCSQFYSFFPPPLEPALPSNVTVIDLLTGTLLQKIVPEVGLVGVYPVGDTVLINSGSRLYQLDLASEEVSLVSEIPKRCVCYPECYPLVLPDKIILPTTPVVCLSRDDYSPLWNLETSLGSLYPEKARVWNIAVSMDRMYVVINEENHRRVLAVDVETGELIWMRDDLLAWPIAADGSVIYAAGVNLYALNAETGAIIWTFETESVRSNIAVGPAAVYLTDIQNYLCAVDKNTGDLKWKTPWEETFHGITYIVQAGDTIICSNILNMSVFSAEDGTELWNVHFRDSPDFDSVRPCPAVTEGILVVAKKEMQYENSIVGIKPEILMALASDPELFVKQGNAFLSEDLKDQAISSYEKAAELYEREGNTSQSQEMRERIQELENQPESPPPESTTPSTPPESTSQPSTPEPSAPIPFSLVILIVALIGIPTAYYLVKYMKSRND